ncbi:MAG: cupin domain-containing protein [Gaiellales bacterium]
MKARLARLDDGATFELAPGVSGRPLFGDDVMFNLVECEPGATVELHSHPHEQLGVILRGSLTLTIDGEDHELGPMQAVALPGGIEHSAIAGPDGAMMLDVFTPVREDYRERYGAA